jgi:hypothetical protein
MIKGMDLMTSIGITVDCEQRCIRWGGTEIPLKTRNTLYNDEILQMLYNAANEPFFVRHGYAEVSMTTSAYVRINAHSVCV